MNSKKVAKFMALAGQSVPKSFRVGSEEERKLGAQLLLSEVLEYVVHGLGVTPEVNGMKITEPNKLHYHAEAAPNEKEMLDGLADVAYTMYWNSNAFGLPLDPAYELVCDNNLEKFVKLGSWARGLKELERNAWNCKSDVSWPPEVVRVQVVEFEGEPYAVGKDANGKVRKPSTYKSVELEPLLSGRGAVS